VSVSRSHGATNPGRKRRRNEDAFVCEPPLFAVADGMGGAQAGEIASSLAATALAGALNGEVAPADAEATVVELIQEANRRVHQRATNDAAASGMGTTMTVALAGADDVVAIGHVGDSRAYLLRDGSLEQLTDDHSLVAELVRRGELSPEEAEVHPQRSVITRALGTDPDVDVDVFSVTGRSNDLFLLCSDGLSTMVDADAIAGIVAQHRFDLESATRALIKAANDSGGEDNITVVLFELDGTAAAPDEPTTEIVHREPEPETATYEVPATAESGVDGDTVVVPAEELRAALAADEHAPAPEEETPPVPIARLVLATLVIIALAALIVFLAIWGLAR
jgi:serine/threonine protein phosphatase PrpC